MIDEIDRTVCHKCGGTGGSFASRQWHKLHIPGGSFYTGFFCVNCWRAMSLVERLMVYTEYLPYFDPPITWEQLAGAIWTSNIRQGE